MSKSVLWYQHLCGWAPAAVLMGGIFFVSSSDAPEIVKEYWFPYQDKVIHALVYFVLSACMVRALCYPKRTITTRILLLAVLLTSAYGASDEWHQSFVPSRTASVGDWIADSLGGMLVFVTSKPLSRLFEIEARWFSLGRGKTGKNN